MAGTMSRPDRVARPWGWYQVLAEATDVPIAAVKTLVVRPGQRLSLQTHDRRAERWLPLDPGLWATIGGWEGELRQGHWYEVPVGVPHRLECRGVWPATVVEVLFGAYDEADIVRLADDHGRAPARQMRADLR